MRCVASCSRRPFLGELPDVGGMWLALCWPLPPAAWERRGQGPVPSGIPMAGVAQRGQRGWPGQGPAWPFPSGPALLQPVLSVRRPRAQLRGGPPLGWMWVRAQGRVSAAHRPRSPLAALHTQSSRRPGPQGGGPFLPTAHTPACAAVLPNRAFSVVVGVLTAGAPLQAPPRALGVCVCVCPSPDTAAGRNTSAGG